MSATCSVCRSMCLPALLFTVLLIDGTTCCGSDACFDGTGQTQPDSVSLNDLVTLLQHATVRISTAEDRCSGVLISESGLILTAAHGLRSADPTVLGRPITVCGWDGRRAAAAIAYQDGAADVAVLRLIDNATAAASWAVISLAPEGTVRVHDSVLAAGFPAREANAHPAVVRLGRLTVAERDALRSTCALTVGDSGGPLVNLRGQLVGIHRRIGLAADSNHHISLPVLLPMIGRWVNPETASADDHSLAVHRELFRTPPAIIATRLRQWMVMVLPDPGNNAVRKAHKADDFSQALISGTVLNDDMVVTKLSDLKQSASFLCRNADGVKRSARLHAADQQLDVALLKLDAPFTGVEYAVSDSDRTMPTNTVPMLRTAAAGVIVFAGCQNRDQRIGDEFHDVCIGIISRVNHDESGVAVRLGAVLDQQRSGQFVVQEIIPGSAAVQAGVQAGDVVIAADQQPLTSLESLAELLRQREPGDWVNLQVSREQESLVLKVRLLPDAATQFEKTEFLDGRAGPLSLRRTGFRGVLQHDLALTPVQCGSPLLDSGGRLIGINIARRGRESTLALPIEQILRLLREPSGVSQSKVTDG